MDKRNMKQNNRKKDFRFGKRARNYDEGFEGKFSEKFYTLAIKHIDLREGYRVLDVGCGTGTILKRLSEKSDVECHGIDVEEEMLQKAREKCPGMDIRLSSCESTLYEDEYFDVITACMAYHHFPDKDAFAREASRIIKKCGRLYIADPRFPYLLRKTINRLLSILNFAGEFYTTNEIAENFSKFGFVMKASYFDTYAQLIILERCAD
jgi:ubiquinone/menaquinone biosynthesis C-methylase UbiE